MTKKGDARRAAIYEYILGYKEAHGGRAPGIRDISAALKIPSTSQVSTYLRNLEDDGLIQLIRSKGQARHIAVPGERYKRP